MQNYRNFKKETDGIFLTFGNKIKQKGLWDVTKEEHSKEKQIQLGFLTVNCQDVKRIMAVFEENCLFSEV